MVRPLPLAVAVLALAAAPAGAEWSTQVVDRGGDLALGGLAARPLTLGWSSGWLTGGTRDALAADSAVAVAPGFVAWRNEDGVHVRAAGDRMRTVGAADSLAQPVVAAAGGHVVVAWREHDASGWHVRASVDFGDAVRLGSGTAAQNPVVAMTPRGEAVVAWFQNGTGRVVQTAVAPFDEDPVALAPLGNGALYLRAATQGDGTVVLAWLSFAEDQSRIVVAERPPGRPFGEPEVVARGGTGDADAVGPPALAALDSTWLLAYRRGASVFTARGTDDPQALERYDFDQVFRGPPAIAADPATGRAVVAWSSRDQRLAVARRGPGGDWTAPELLSGGGVDAVAAAQGDDPAVAWTAGTGADRALTLARFSTPADGPAPDRTPPRLSAGLPRPFHLAPRLALRLRCGEPCRVRAVATLSADGRRLGGGTWSGSLRGERIVVRRLALRQRARERAARALARGTKVTVAVRVRATDAAGNARVVTRAARVVR